jgi:protein-tyrosine phosphatase
VELRLPDGTTVLARGRLDLVPAERPREPDFGLYLDRRWREDAEVTWPSTVLDWEDFGLPRSEADLFKACADLHRRIGEGQLVEVACFGGIGRTGTALSCLALLAGAPSAAEAVSWVRANYHPSAVETAEQEQLIARFAVTLGAP